MNQPATAPVAGWFVLRSYQREWLKSDLAAGLTVTAYLVPQVMAYAAIAGLPPVTGLWAILPSLVIYAFLGTSRQLSVGPESTTALMTAGAIAPLAEGDPGRYAALSAALAIATGGLCLVAWLLRLGFIADLLSRPVLVGYLTGVAVLMIVSQLGRVSGVDVTGDTTLEQLQSFLTNLGQVDPLTAVVAAGVLAFLLLARESTPWLPTPLVAVLAATALSGLFGLADRGLEVVGQIASGLPVPGWPDVTAADFVDLLPAAAGVLLVGYTDNVLTARAFAARRGERLDANAELLALGSANIGAGAFSGFPVSSSGSRTAVGDAAGSRTQLHSIVAALAVLLILLFGRGLLSAFPQAALGALVIYAAIRLIDIPAFRTLASYSRVEFGLALTALFGVLVAGVLPGVLVAVGLSLLAMLRRIARPHDAVLGFVPGLAGMHDVEDYRGVETVPGLVIYRYDAPLFFANSENFLRRALTAVDLEVAPVRWFILNAEAMPEMDATAIEALRTLRTTLSGRGIRFGLARATTELRADLQRAGFLEEVGEDMIFPTLPTVVSAFRDQGGELTG
jgi:high affinity sulfate transporter 1